MDDQVSNDERQDRLILNEPAQEVTVSPEEFNKEWITLKDCTTILGVETKKAVYDIIKREGLVSKVFMLGKKPVRHVNRNSLNEYLGKRHSDANTVDVRNKNTNVTNPLLTQELGNMLVSVRDLPNQVRDLTEAIRGVNNHLANVVEKIVDQGIDLKEKWLQDRERRSEIDLKHLGIQEKQLKAQQDLIARVSGQGTAQQGLIEKITKQKPTNTWVVPVSLMVFFAVVIGSGIYYFGSLYQKEAGKMQKIVKAARAQVNTIDKAYTKSIYDRKIELLEKDREIEKLKAAASQSE